MPMAESSAEIVVGIKVTNAPGISGESGQSADGDQEDQRETCEQDSQRDFVRGFLAARTFNECDHAVEEALALCGGDEDRDGDCDHPRARRDGRAVAARLADHRRAFAGDGGFVDTGDAFNDFAVGRDEIAGFDQHEIANREERGGDDLVAAGLADQPLGDEVRLGGAQRSGLRLAAPFGHRFSKIPEQHCQPEPEH